MAQRNHKKFKNTSASIEIHELIRLWMLRILIALGGLREVIYNNGMSHERIVQTLGLIEGLEGFIDADFDAKLWRARILKMHRDAEKSHQNRELPGKMAENIGRFAALAGLSDTDCRILEFVVFLHAERILDDTADLLGDLSTAKVPSVLAVLLDLPEQEVRVSLSVKGTLNRSGLISINRNGSDRLRNKLNVLSSRFAENIIYSDADPVALLSDIVVPGRPASLHFEDFTHIEPSLRLLRPYLSHAISTRKQGVNIFIYGTPGTGKSELSRLLAQDLGCELFEVTAEGEDGEAVNGEKRLQAFSAAQNFFVTRRAIILFDEVEDIFEWNPFISHERRPQSRKAWINRTLEENPVPTIWVSNSVWHMDRAVIRRFDMVIELPVPPKRQRVRIVQQACGDILPVDSVNRIADTEHLAPAVITRAASVARCIRKDIGEQGIPVAIELLIGNTLAAQGHRSMKGNDANQLPQTFDPGFINAEIDLALAAAGLKETKSGRLCLYGPPGTGKTAFGRWLADEIGIPLNVKRASDLLSMYVGGTEQNIAKAFREAEQEGALLLIDEVDSFLQDRRHAQRSWEVTGVNEMLTQMESFPGVFIASTNLMDGLDQAALRRFDLKVRFNFLTREQAWLLFKRYCSSLLFCEPEPELRARLARLVILTPGDFATMARQNRFRPVENPAALITALEKECQVKEDGPKKSFGFF